MPDERKSDEDCDVFFKECTVELAPFGSFPVRCLKKHDHEVCLTCGDNELQKKSS